jgi:hypothetical protein
MSGRARVWWCRWLLNERSRLGGVDSASAYLPAHAHARRAAQHNSTAVSEQVQPQLVLPNTLDAAHAAGG